MSLWMMGGVTSSWRYARPLAVPSATISRRRQFIREPPRPITSLQKSEYVSNAFRYVYVDRLINQYMLVCTCVSLDVYMCMNCIMYVVMYGGAFVCMIICTIHGYGCRYTCMHSICTYICTFICVWMYSMYACVCIHMYIMIYNVRVCVCLYALLPNRLSRRLPLAMNSYTSICSPCS